MKAIFYSLLLFFALFSYSQEQTAKDFQDNLNAEYAKKETSPLTAEDLKIFKALDFFKIDSKYIVEATFVRFKNEKEFGMKTSTSRLPKYLKYGELHFQIDGKNLKLNLYQDIDLSKQAGYEDYLFLPFTDMTCGNKSYIGGRYLDMKFPKSNKVVIDFNKAYNPYCAYNHRYSCPIVPAENDLKIEILAGVKKFHK
jgi:uncharacterized protein